MTKKSVLIVLVAALVAVLVILVIVLMIDHFIGLGAFKITRAIVILALGVVAAIFFLYHDIRGLFEDRKRGDE